MIRVHGCFSPTPASPSPSLMPEAIVTGMQWGPPLVSEMRHGLS